MTSIIDFTNFSEVVIAALVLSGIVFLRYVFVCLVFTGVFKMINSDHYQHRKISTMLRPPNQSWQEIKWSAITSVIFAISGIAMVWLWQEGYTRIYLDIGEKGYGYAACSLVLALFLHETYYYWLHRWMHRPAIYKIIHKVHHDSIVTSPWTSFSFHPLESILQAIVVPVLIIWLPMHYSIVLILLIIMTISAAINHLDIEIYPAGTEKHWLGKWIIGATHHSQHHSQFRLNYGLYFTFWDKWMGTESSDYEELFRKKTSVSKQH